MDDLRCLASIFRNVNGGGGDKVRCSFFFFNVFIYFIFNFKGAQYLEVNFIFFKKRTTRPICFNCVKNDMTENQMVSINNYKQAG